MKYVAQIAGHEFNIEVQDRGTSVAISLNGKSVNANLYEAEDRDSIFAMIGNLSLEAELSRNSRGYAIYHRGNTYHCLVQDEQTARMASLMPRASQRPPGKELRSPMPGLVVSILVKPGQTVNENDGLIVLEAMKMENEFYRVSIDAKSGGLKSIFDKETGRELIDADSEYRLGELIYASGGEGSYAISSNLKALPAPKFTYHRQQGVRISQANGPVFGGDDQDRLRHVVAAQKPLGRVQPQGLVRQRRERLLIAAVVEPAAAELALRGVPRLLSEESFSASS